jgi:hypothetical protein
MHQREVALKALKKAAGKERNSRIAEFVRFLGQHYELCWSDYVDVIREQFPADREAMALAIWETGDKVLRTNLVRHLDPGQPAEVKILQRLIKSCRGLEDEAELLIALEKDDRRILAQMKKLKSISLETSAMIEARLRLPA